MKLLIIHTRAREYAALIKSEIDEELAHFEIVAATDKSEVPSSIEDVDEYLRGVFQRKS